MPTSVNGSFAASSFSLRFRFRSTRTASRYCRASDAFSSRNLYLRFATSKRGCCLPFIVITSPKAPIHEQLS